MKKKLVVLLSLCMLVATMMGCGKAVETEDFTSGNGGYTISLPEIKDGWVAANETSNDDMLAVDNKDQSFSIIMQAFPKVEGVDYTNYFDTFVEFYIENTSSGWGEPTELDVQIGDPAITPAKTLYYEVDYGYVVSKVQLSIYETETAYYTCILTGINDIYDEYIGDVTEALKSFREN